MTAVWIVGGEVAAVVLVTAAAIWLAGWWLKYRRRGFGWALATVSLWLLIYVGLAIGLMKFGSGLGQIGLAWITFVQVCVEWWLIQEIQGTTVKRAAIGWGAGTVARLMAIAIMLVMVHVRFFEAYQVPSMSMSPAIEEGDRVLVSKFLELQRWDLVTFRHGYDIYVKRLAGMPGEEISMDEEGHVVVNGTRAAGPAEKPEIVFHWPALIREDMALRPGGKMLLGPGEYFVLGDFGENSMDSRFWGAVKREEMDGVVTWIYWPLSRMRIVR